MSPLATANDLHAALHQFQTIQTCKNILEYKPPMDLNVDLWSILSKACVATLMLFRPGEMHDNHPCMRHAHAQLVCDRAA